MKNWLLIAAVLCSMCFIAPGCATLGSHQPWPDNVPQIKADVFMFAKLATRITLVEAETTSEDVDTIKNYLIALQDLLSVPGVPDFTGARLLLASQLPQKYIIYGFTIIDVLERYLQSAELDLTQDQEAVLQIISAGIGGALEAVEEFNI